jgi:hypothetical protein
MLLGLCFDLRVRTSPSSGAMVYMKLWHGLFIGFVIGAVVSFSLTSPFSIRILFVRVLGATVVSTALIGEFGDFRHEFSLGNIIEHTVVATLVVCAVISARVALDESNEDSLKPKLFKNVKAPATPPAQTPIPLNASATRMQEARQTNSKTTPTAHQIARPNYQDLRPIRQAAGLTPPATGLGPKGVGSLRPISPAATSSTSMPLSSVVFDRCEGDGRVFAQIFVTVLGVDPLRNVDMVFYAISDVEPTHLMYGGRETYHAHFQTFTSAFRAGILVPKEDRITVAVKSSATNGMWTQIVKAHRIGHRWESRSVIFDDNLEMHSPRSLRDTSSSGYPWDERRRPILPVLQTDVGQVIAGICDGPDSKSLFRRIRALNRSDLASQQLHASRWPFANAHGGCHAPIVYDGFGTPLVNCSAHPITWH